MEKLSHEYSHLTYIDGTRDHCGLHARVPTTGRVLCGDPMPAGGAARAAADEGEWQDARPLDLDAQRRSEWIASYCAQTSPSGRITRTYAEGLAAWREMTGDEGA